MTPTLAMEVAGLTFRNTNVKHRSLGRPPTRDV
jgi:hypothetical protein